MAVKQTGRKVYKTMQGKAVDMDLLRQKNELTPAVGNARVNARGDELGPGGKIIRKREDLLADYYRDNPERVEDELPTSKNSAPETAVVEETSAPKKTAKQKVQEAEIKEVSEDEWVEDEDGNFVQKGE
jgi:hypothetical protein